MSTSFEEDYCSEQVYSEMDSINPLLYLLRDLNIQGEMAMEWDDYVNILTMSGITLSDISGPLVWNFNKLTGKVTLNLAYSSIVEKHMECSDIWWGPMLWKGKLRLKIKCFSWLFFNHKILT